MSRAVVSDEKIVTLWFHFSAFINYGLIIFRNSPFFISIIIYHFLYHQLSSFSIVKIFLFLLSIFEGSTIELLCCCSDNGKKSLMILNQKQISACSLTVFSWPQISTRDRLEIAEEVDVKTSFPLLLLSWKRLYGGNVKCALLPREWKKNVKGK